MLFSSPAASYDLELGLHRISAPAPTNPAIIPKSGQVQLWPYFQPDLADASAAAVRSVNYG